MSGLYFPQFGVGSVAQYPVSRQWSKPANVNVGPGGEVYLMPRVTPARTTWKLSYRGLSAAEWSALETLFAATEGSYGTFTFVDPTDNLLRWSEDLTNVVWTADPELQISVGAVDPLSGTAASRLINIGQASQELVQALAGPGWQQYCFSIYLRSDVATSVSLIRKTASTMSKQAATSGKSWMRFTASGALEGEDDGISFGIELAPGCCVDVFGPQVEAQTSAGPYKSKYERSGVFTKCRFDQDVLTQTSDSTGRYSTTIQLTSND